MVVQEVPLGTIEPSGQEMYSIGVGTGGVVGDALLFVGHSESVFVAVFPSGQVIMPIGTDGMHGSGLQ